MGDVVLITGGSRSGKSTLAQRMAESLPAPRVFVATCPVFDDEEMLERIRRHREARAAAGWSTVEDEVGLAAALASRSDAGVLVVDCLTLWINNLMRRAEVEGRDLGDDEMIDEARRVSEAARSAAGTTILVSNEVAMGIVPDSPMVRLYRDLVGRCNQTVAAAADVVVLTVCGLPLVVKGHDHPLAALALEVS